MNFRIIKFIQNYFKTKKFLKFKISSLIFFIIIIFNYINKSNQINRLKMLIKGKKFVNKCLKGILINRNKFVKSNIKIITAIIPIYNCEKTIKSSIRSIQNQNVSEIEIILVNDYSKDNSLKIIKDLKIEDSRIIIINNIRNMGTLYSRSIGALTSKGSYIFALDNDDMFFDMDIFDLMYKRAKKENFDIFGFKSILIKKKYNYNIKKMVDNRYSNNKNNLIVYQPKLGIFSISKKGKYKQNNTYIWGKCIKSLIYKKAVNSLGILRYSSFMSWAEDSSIILIIFNIAKSYKFIHKYGIIHFLSNSTSSHTQSIKNKLFGELFLLNTIYDFSNDKYKSLSILYFLQIKKKYKLKVFKLNKNLLFVKFILKKILKNKFINKNNKKKLFNLLIYFSV